MSPELSHWLVVAIKCGLIYFIGLPLAVLGIVALVGLAIGLVTWATK